MCKILAITNSTLCREGIYKRVKLIAPFVDGVILREKNLAENDYLFLAEKILKICQSHNIYCIFHTFFSACGKLLNPSFHAPESAIKSLTDGQKSSLKIFGSSCHSVKEAMQAEKVGCNYILAGHVFETDCKKGLAPRGLKFLNEVCTAVNIPVFALGGVTAQNAASCISAGAAGVAVMSGAMTCADPESYFLSIREGMKCSTQNF